MKRPPDKNITFRVHREMFSEIEGVLTELDDEQPHMRVNVSDVLRILISMGLRARRDEKSSAREAA